MRLGITGVFCSGKTTVAKLLEKKGYKNINADKIGHKLLNKTQIKNKVIKEFGTKILTKNKISRRKLKNIVFYNKNKLKKLNKIIHPHILKDIKSQLKKHKKAVVDGALLIEAKYLKLFDKLIVVKINKKQQLKRALKKKNYTKKEIDNILKSQLSQKEKLKYADIILDNSRNLNHLKNEISNLSRKL